MEYSRFSVRIGGAAGDGLQSTGLLLQKYLNKLGYFVVGHPGTQSTIRGGHVWQHVEFATEQIQSFDRPLDLLIALKPVTLDVHFRDLKKNSFLIINSDVVKVDRYQREIEEFGINIISIPMTSIAREIDLKTSILANTVSIGATIALLSLDSEAYLETLKQRFQGKSNIFDMNFQALTEGISIFEENYEKYRRKMKTANALQSNRIVVTGNEMISLGAIASGLKFLAQYPITPASSILTYLANRSDRYGVVVRQAEDELAAITMCIGASYAGARSMTASSGPGLSLMAEALGYAAMTETPIVIVNSMRSGPSTGIPTKMEQGDLSSMIFMSHGESPRVILAPRNIPEAFELTVKAFNIADRYQMPVIILSDFALSERTHSIEPFELDVEIDRGKIWTGPTEEFPFFKRYQNTPDGISPRAFPLTENAQYILVGAEHDEESHSLSGNRCGLPLSWEIREKMFEKRFKKLEGLRQEMQVPDFYGPSKADVTILSWGSTEGAIREVIDALNLDGDKTWNMLAFSELFPFPHKKVQPLLDKVNHSVIFEVNYTGQFENLIHQHLNWRPDHNIHPLTGETPTPTMIIDELRKLKLN